MKFEAQVVITTIIFYFAVRYYLRHCSHSQKKKIDNFQGSFSLEISQDSTQNN